MTTNLIYIFLITFLLIAAGSILKASIAILQGRKIKFNVLNPLNLRARWPKNKIEKDLKD